MMSNRLIVEGLAVLKEVFNRPYPLRLKSRGSFISSYESVTEDGRSINISFNGEPIEEFLDNEYDMELDNDKLKDMGYDERDRILTTVFNVDATMRITGEGDAPRIFATVIEAMKNEFYNNPNVVGFRFGAEKASRSRLYLTMIRRMSRKFGLTPLDVGGGRDNMYAILVSKRRAPYLFKLDLYRRQLDLGSLYD